MRRWRLLAVYCIPYAYLAIWSDAVYGSILLYAVMVAAFFLLCRAAVKAHNLLVVLSGNLLSLGVSSLCLTAFGLQDAVGYFKPFTPWALLLVISVVATLGQVSYGRRALKKE